MSEMVVPTDVKGAVVRLIRDHNALRNALDRLVTSVEMFSPDMDQDVAMYEARQALDMTRERPNPALPTLQEKATDATEEGT